MTSTHPAADAIARATVHIHGPAGNCTGTLVSKRLVVTAAHCVTVPASPGGFGASYKISFPLVAALSQTVNQKQDVIMHVDFPGEGVDPKQGELPFNDIGLIRLPADAPSQYQPAHLLKEDSPLRPLKLTQGQIKSRGQKALIAGFGRLERASPVTDFQMAELELYIADEEGGRLGFVADASATCKGDSGGPTFVFHKGQLTLVGVNSAGSCGGEWDINVNGVERVVRLYDSWSTDVRVFIPWILEHLTPSERASLKYSKVTYEAAESSRPDDETIGVLGYMQEVLSPPAGG